MIIPWQLLLALAIGIAGHAAHTWRSKQTQKLKWEIRFKHMEEEDGSPFELLMGHEKAWFVGSPIRNRSWPYPYFRKQDAIRACEELNKRWPILASDGDRADFDAVKRVKDEIGIGENLYRYLAGFVSW